MRSAETFLKPANTMGGGCVGETGTSRSARPATAASAFTYRCLIESFFGRKVSAQQV
jgi:hypothetical protein